MANIGKREIVKMLLKNKELENEDEEQLMEILFNEPNKYPPEVREQYFMNILT